MKIGSYFLALVVGIPALMGTTPSKAGTHSAPGCSPDTAHRNATVEYFKMLTRADTGDYAAARAAMRVPLSDSSLVAAVTSDSVCAIAAVTINRNLGYPDTASRSLVLVHVDTVYVAEELNLKAGEFDYSFVLNSALDSVLVRIL